MGALWADQKLKKQKNIILKCHCLLLYTTTVNHFSIQLCHAMKNTFYRTTRPAQWLGQEETPKHFQKPNLDTHTHRHKAHDHCLVVCCPSDPLQLSESWSSHTTSALKVQWTGLWSFASSAIFSWSLTNWLPILRASWQHFCTDIHDYWKNHSLD